MRGSAGSRASTATSSSGLSAFTPSDRRQRSWELAPRFSGMLAMKEQFPQRNGRPWRLKDIADIEILRGLAARERAGDHRSPCDRARSSPHQEPAPEAAAAHQARPLTEREPPVGTDVDAQARIAREQAAAKAVSPAMLAVTSLRHPDSRAQERGPSRRSCLLDTVLRAAGEAHVAFRGRRAGLRSAAG